MSSISQIFDRLFTPIDDAIEQLKLRQEDHELVRAVCEFLGFDIPKEFNADQPLLYLPRHLATPSFEVLYAMDLARDKSAVLIIGQDKGGKFVGQNELKRSLGKLPILVGENKKGEEIMMNKNVIDFSKSQGLSLSNVMTIFGVSLPELHEFLMCDFERGNVRVMDETDWINRYARDDISKQYKRMLAYSCAHVAMVEWFTPKEMDFVEGIVMPTLEAVESEFGLSPLVVQLMDPRRDKERNWNAYPAKVLTRLEELGCTKSIDGA